MKVLVTGSKGFLGREIVKAIEAQGDEVVHYDILDGFDVLNLGQLEKAIAGVDQVVHLAAIANLYRSQKDPDETFQINVVGTKRVAQICTQFKKRLVYASTCCVYGDQKHELLRGDRDSFQEDVALPNPAEYYGNSKYAGEIIIKGYHTMFDLKYVMMRFATIWGEGMRPELGMHIFFRQALRNEPITVHGTGKQTRTLTHVKDLARGVAFALRAPDNQVYNISTDVSFSAVDLAHMIKKVTGSSSEIVFIEDRKGQVMDERIEFLKLNEATGWKPEMEINEENLAALIPWMKKDLGIE
jgi:nucleoside-diphosphate-sugar epimerase